MGRYPLRLLVITDVWSDVRGLAFGLQLYSCSSQGHALRAAAAVVLDRYRRCPSPGRGRPERHRDRTLTAGRDACTAVIRLREVSRVSSSHADTDDFQCRLAGIGQSHGLQDARSY